MSLDFFLWISLERACIISSILGSFKTMPLIVTKWIKSRLFKYLILLSNLSSEIEDDRDLHLFLSILKYSDLDIYKLLSIFSPYTLF